MNGASEEQEQVFLVDISATPGDDSANEWHGRVEHVGSDRRLYFSNFGGLCEFMLLEDFWRSP